MRWLTLLWSRYRKIRKTAETENIRVIKISEYINKKYLQKAP